MDEIETEEETQACIAFYEQLTEYAKANGVTVSIISIAGEECNIETIGKIAIETGGFVQRVVPEELTKNFANVLAVPVIASNVVANIKIHKALEFRNEEERFLQDNKTLLVRDLGNVTEETEVTFEYRMKPP